MRRVIRKEWIGLPLSTIIRSACSSIDDARLASVIAAELGATGELSVDVFQAPILVQSWFVLDRIRQLAQAEGGTMADVFKLVQYFTDLRDYPLYNRVRGLFYPQQPPVSTVVEVSGMLPSRQVRVEVEATAFIPQNRANQKE